MSIGFPPALLTLTDGQLATIMAATHPMQPAARSAFLAGVAARLAGAGEIGDGTVARACRDPQRQHFDPPDLSHTEAAQRRGYGALALGLVAAAKGVKFGRKPKLMPYQQREAQECLAKGDI